MKVAISHLLLVTLERHGDAVAGQGVVSGALKLVVEAIVAVTVLLVGSVSAVILSIT